MLLKTQMFLKHPDIGISLHLGLLLFSINELLK